MRFNGNQAWHEATRIITANREVLMVMAGVFYFVPGVAAAFFLAPMQTDMLTRLTQGGGLSNPAAASQIMQSAMLPLLPYVALLFLVQLIGNLAMMALLTDQRRPTVGEALMIAVKCLPTLIGTVILLIIGYLIFSIGAGLAASLVMVPLALLKAPALGTAAMFVVIFIAIGIFVTRVSLILPVMVIEGERNPVHVIAHSWKAVKGNTRRLLLFYVLLFVAYVVVGLTLALFLQGFVAVSAGHGSAFAIGSGILSGAIGGLSGVLLTAILVAVHRQLAGLSLPEITRTFE